MDDAAMSAEFSFVDEVREILLKRLPTTGIDFTEHLIPPSELATLDPWGDLRSLTLEHGEWWIKFR